MNTTRSAPTRRHSARVKLPWAALAVTAGSLLGAAPAQAQLNTQVVASGLSQPLFAARPLDDSRLFIVERGGVIKFANAGNVHNFMSIPVETGGDEQGLLGLAFDPTWGGGGANSNRFFVNYIDPTNGDTVIASYRTLAGNPDAGDPGSRTEILRIDQPSTTNHKAGWIGFKPGDANNLYIATGDGGGSYDPDNHGQRLDTLLGKMLRVNVNGSNQADGRPNYDIPGDNLHATNASALGEIWAYGLRNPYRNSFDSSGNLFIADVGQGSREELNFVAASAGAGANFGWRLREGDIQTPTSVGGPAPADHHVPFLVYDLGGSQSITGGYVVEEAGSPLFGRYVFADYIIGRIWSATADGSAQKLPGGVGSGTDVVEITGMLEAGEAGAIGNISSFGIGQDGEIYIVEYGANARVIQVVPEPGSAALMLLGAAALAWRLRRQR